MKQREPYDSCISVSCGLMYCEAKIHAPSLDTRLASFHIFWLLIPVPNWLVWWALQQTFRDELPHTKHAAKCPGRDEDEAFISKEPGPSLPLALRLGPEVGPDNCSGTSEFPLLSVRNRTTYSDFGTTPFLGKSQGKVLATAKVIPLSCSQLWDLPETQRLLWVSKCFTGLWSPFGHPWFSHKSNSRELFSSADLLDGVLLNHQPSQLSTLTARLGSLNQAYPNRALWYPEGRKHSP